MKCQWVSGFLGAEPETDIRSYVIFLRAILNTCNNLSIICEHGDVQIVEMGYDIKMPDFLDKNSKQFTSEQANETRLVTKCRWVVESFHARFKKWRIFAERIDQSFILNIAALTRILAACINKYRAVLYDANSPEHDVIAHRMLQARQRRSEIERLVSSNQLSMRKSG